jgi:hypothetical protein
LLQSIDFVCSTLFFTAVVRVLESVGGRDPNVSINVDTFSKRTMSSYFLTGQKSQSGGGGGGGVGFASTVQVIASDGSAKIRPVNTHGGYLDASMERYENDDSLCFLEAVSDLDHVEADPASTNIATEPLRRKDRGLGMAIPVVATLPETA